MTERDFVIEHIRERLRRLASQQDMLTCEHMLEAEIERLIGIASLGGIREMRAEVERLRDEAHYAKGVCDLAMKHRDIAEAEVERLRTENNMLRSLIVDAPTEAERDELIARRALENKP